MFPDQVQMVERMRLGELDCFAAAAFELAPRKHCFDGVQDRLRRRSRFQFGPRRRTDSAFTPIYSVSPVLPTAVPGSR